MKILLPVRASLLILLLASAAAAASAQANVGSRVIITQIYGAGGNSGSTASYDYVELFNPTASAIDLSTYSFQYESQGGAATTATNILNLTGTILPGHFYLAQLSTAASSTPTTKDLPTADVAAGATQVQMAASGGKGFLLPNQNLLATGCPQNSSTSTTFISFVPFSATANCIESTSGTAYVTTSSTVTGLLPPPTTTASALYRAGSATGNVITFTDTGNSQNDFPTTASAVPRNAALDFLWVANAKGTVSKLGGTGSFAPNVVTGTDHGAAATTATVGGVAIDNSGRAWSVTTTSSNVNIENVASTSTSAITGTSVNAPTAIAIDGAGTAWIANGTNNTISAISNAGTELSPGTATSGTYQKGGYGQGAGVYSAPRGVAIDLSGNVWVANNTGGTVTQILGAAAPAAPLSTALANSTVASSAQGVTP